MSCHNGSVLKFLGTMWLVFGGCGSAVAGGGLSGSGIGFAGVALAFGLTVLTMAYAVGHISGAHFNPAVTVGLWAGGRFPASDIVPYIVVQVLGAIAAAAVLYLIASGKARLRPLRRVRLERLRRALAGRLFDDLGCFCRGVTDLLLSARHPRLHARPRPRRLRAAGDRLLPDTDPPDQHSGYQHLGQPGAQHRTGGVRRRLGSRPALAVLGGADRRRIGGRVRLSLARRRGRRKIVGEPGRSARA